MTERRQRKDNPIENGFTPEPLADDFIVERVTESDEEYEGTGEAEPQAENLYIGQCVGGPMNGQQGESRFPKGFVLIDRPNSAAWVYDYDPNSNTFTAGEQDIHDKERGRKAAEEANYDIRALEPPVFKPYEVN